jgi:hypothetical protein
VTRRTLRPKLLASKLQANENAPDIAALNRRSKSPERSRREYREWWLRARELVLVPAA